MLENFDATHRSETVLKLATLPRERINAMLLRRGIPEDSIDDAIQGLADIGTPVAIEDLASFPFSRRENRERPYGWGRFHDGTLYGVYYSALERATCENEVKHHLRKEGLNTSLAFPRYYQLLESKFSGVALDLVGHETNCVELISPTESGYPYCQRLAAEAHARAIDALQTRSARHPDGICLPILSSASNTKHRVTATVRMSAENGDVRTEDLR